jgi:TolA-binding protein
MSGDDMKSDHLRRPAAELVELARDELGEMSGRRLAEGYAKLNARRSRPARRVRLFLTAAAAGLTVVTALFVGRQWYGEHQAGPLSYAVDGGRLEPGGAIEAVDAQEPTLRFSDGTEVVFLAGARGRVRSVDEHGARIALIGKAKVDVIHWRGARWLFDAGPYLITVKGTSFTAEWRDADERLEIVLKTGSVAVSGPLSDEAITLRAGQRLTISTREKEVVIRDIDARPETSAVASVAPPPWGQGVDNASPPLPGSPPSERVTHRAGAIAPAATASAPAAQRSWTAALAAGHFADILQQAEQRGLEIALSEASSDDLAALADAARYSRRDDLARRALSAQRRRFPGSARASDAAFLLGRLEETAQHPDLALAWYERCLAESPRGTYTSEALGRKMTVVQRHYGVARARPIAEEYLQRFSNGTYAAAARALTRAP